MFHHGKNTSSGFGTGLLAGAVVGAGLALLYAPKAGAELRGDIGESAGALRDSMTERYRDLAARVAGRLDTLLARVERAADRLEAEARDLVEAGAEAIPSGRRTNG
ncbi:MAG: YtxH domain-containing protein [Acidobacteria bacterium]|nr:YtxH domain-containing protein [Acidobacteriota bacterium]